VLNCDNPIVVGLYEPASGIGDEIRCGLLAASREKLDDHKNGDEGLHFDSTPTFSITAASIK